MARLRSLARPRIASFARHLRSPFLRNRLLVGLLAGATLGGATGCSTHHWARVESAELSPPKGDQVLHTSRLVVDVVDSTDATECVVYEKYSPVCFHNLRPSLEKGLENTLWASFPEVVIGSVRDAGPSDYVLEVDVTLDALPPDDAGPGWSAGARSRFRLLREGKVLREETLASRSRAVFPYGAPLGTGASEAVDATILHIAERVSAVPESRPHPEEQLPTVAARQIEAPKAADKQAAGKKATSDKASPSAPATASAQAKIN